MHPNSNIEDVKLTHWYILYFCCVIATLDQVLSWILNSIVLSVGGALEPVSIRDWHKMFIVLSLHRHNIVKLFIVSAQLPYVNDQISISLDLMSPWQMG